MGRLHRQSGAGRWSLTEEEFGATLATAAGARFGDTAPGESEVERFLLSLHLDDLALACACAAGRPEAWDYFVLHFRPILYRAARALRAPGDARELADSIYADLYGLEQRDGARRSLLAYFHGRSSLAGWLRSVLAQRAVDRARAAKRMEPLPEEPEAAERVIARAVAVGGRSGDPPDPDRERLLAAARRAFASALASLEPGDRLRLALYYTQGLRLAQIGRIVGESEATVSRKLDRIRRGIRAGVERRLRDEAGLSGMQVAQAFEYAAEDGDFDVRRTLPVPDS